MKKNLLLVLFIGCCFAASYAQDNPQKDSSNVYVPAKPVLGFISDSHVLFDATGGTDSHIQVTCKGDWFATASDDWFTVSEKGNYLEVRCLPNSSSKARNGHITIIAEGGTSTGNVLVQQKAEGSSSKYTIQTNSTVPTTAENQSFPVKVSFEAGKTAPSFEKVWSILKFLEDNNNFGLQIEIPWCKNDYGIDLIEQRIQNVTDYFITSGIDKARITPQITVIGVDEGSTECDCAHLKITK